MTIRSDYLERGLIPNERKKRLDIMTRFLEKRKDQFDAIAFRGVSGALMAIPLADALDKPLIVVRKDASHSYIKVEGAIGAERILIVDDFIESGETVASIINDIRATNRESKFYGIALYNSDRNRPFIYSSDAGVEISLSVGDDPLDGDESIPVWGIATMRELEQKEMTIW